MYIFCIWTYHVDIDTNKMDVLERYLFWTCGFFLLVRWGVWLFVRFKCIRYPAYTRTPEMIPQHDWSLVIEIGGADQKEIGPTINSGFEWNNRLRIVSVFVAFTGIVDDHDSLITDTVAQQFALALCAELALFPEAPLGKSASLFWELISEYKNTAGTSTSDWTIEIHRQSCSHCSPKHCYNICHCLQLFRRRPPILSQLIIYTHPQKNMFWKNKSTMLGCFVALTFFLTPWKINMEPKESPI